MLVTISEEELQISGIKVFHCATFFTKSFRQMITYLGLFSGKLLPNSKKCRRQPICKIENGK